MSKINWVKARADYIKDSTQTYALLAKKYGVSVDHLTHRAVEEGWTEERRKTTEKAQQKLPEKISESLAQVNARQAGLGKILQHVSAESLKMYKPQSFEDARLGILTGVTIERKALGLDLDEVKNEVYQNFQQFSFIFNLTEDELRRFIKAAAARAGWTMTENT